MRQADELSTTSAPAAAKRGDHSREVAPPALKSATSKPWIVSSSSGWTTMSPSCLPAERAEAKGHDLVGGKAAALEQREQQRADGPGGAHHGDPHDANSPKGLLGRIVPSPESSKALCSALTASGRDRPGRRRRSGSARWRSS
jgi:hypothetical protein